MVVIFHRRSQAPSRFLFLTIGDWLIIVVSQLAAVYLRLGLELGGDYIQQHWASLVSSIVIYLVVFYAGGMYEPPARSRQMEFDFLPLIVTFIAAGINGLLLYTRPQMVLGRGIWLISSLLILLLTYGLRRFFLRLLGKGFFRKQALLLCDHPDRAADLVRLVEQSPYSPYQICGLIRAGSIPAANYAIRYPVLGTTAQLERVIQDREVATLLLSVSPMRSHELLSRLRPLRYAGVEIMDYISLCEELAQEIPLAHINDEWLMTAALNSSVVSIRKIKRAMDIAVALIGLIPGLPLMLFASVLIRLTSPGPAIYRQVRVGLGGKPYVLYKLRTMRMDAESGGAAWSGPGDSRVTPVGYFLRQWRIDELPQLFNILKGEMSLVGPRPERPEFTEKLAAYIPFYNERHLVQPGLTGWAQIRFPYAASVEAAARKLQYDLYYIKNMSFWLDVAILLKTFKTILVGLRHEEEFLPAEDKLEEWLVTGDSPPGSPPAKGGAQ